MTFLKIISDVYNKTKGEDGIFSPVHGGKHWGFLVLYMAESTGDF